MSFRASTGESGLRVLPDLFKNRVLQLAEETVDSLQVRTCGAGIALNGGAAVNQSGSFLESGYCL